MARAGQGSRRPAVERAAVIRHDASSDTVRPRGAWIVFAVCAGAAGAWLRLHQLDGQILLDDEWHAIHRLLVADVRAIASRLGFADYSIPLTIVDRILYDHGLLSERWMHWPAAIAGVALLGIAPWLVRRWFALPTLAVFVALLAIAPLLVYHSMVARPYAFTALLAPLAIVAFEGWWRERRLRQAAAYVLATWLAGYLHPVVLPFVLMPLAYRGLPALLQALRGGASRTRPLLRVAAVGIVVAALLGASLAPPIVNDWRQFSAKAGRDALTLAGTWHSAAMLAGSAHAAVAVAVFALAALGWRRLRSRDAATARYLLVVNAVAVAAIGASGIQWIFHPLVYARYLLPALVFVLLFVAEGLVALIERLRPVALRPVVAAAAVAGLYLAGPWPAIDYVPNQFIGHLRFQYDYDAAANPYVTEVPREPVPAFYRELARLPARSVTLVEMPWRLESNFNPHPWYQEVHRQDVMIGLVTPVCGERTFGEYAEGRSGLAMRHFIHLSAMLRGETRGADYLVVHLRPWKTPPDADVEWPDMTRCLGAIDARFGPPVDTRDDLVVYRLKR